MIPVTKAYLPPIDKYKKYVDRIYESGWLTNNGFLVQELEQRLKEHLGVKNLILVANGSLALQLAYKAMKLKGEVITTPFSFIATTSTLVWEGLTPIFADINKETFNIVPELIEQKITSETSAILPVHVFGNACEVEKIQAIADKHKLKVIYDAAHAFGIRYNNKSIFNYGDISTVSFHATKLFHSIEGGAVITNDDDVADKVRELINFGIVSSDRIGDVGTNAKMNEFEAAMGLCVLDDIDYITEQQRKLIEIYKSELNGFVDFQITNSKSTESVSYMPVLLKNEKQVLDILEKLKLINVHPRRYFHPSLDTIKYLQPQVSCDCSRDISSRILCLPLYTSLSEMQVVVISKIIKESISVGLNNVELEKDIA
ncbi:DegT/DnrJ/EryC1/StrS family aminotransferase [Moritella sp.]|uniref:DegT/DnrJ/EryC1/StrS family aminotransferase n=1 Tax=Moritella sp. TaxID=78556 RepID=UPI001D4A9A12|nr:DegT/DnrJ/EryC1/StrS family aminotransferase [Moritella sp.]MCJ8347942.1 DegT/DnrJ/EryC1/StrS family aminotransferase [Moritella sp.]NQZ40385.1 DegT/DnrJ/EryC1/StrS family aminotransferase [Moritella sp.]